MNISLIAAIGKNRELGKENQLIWYLPEDLKFFKKMTMGKKIIMGRKTFESLPKMLPGRTHIVLSRSRNDFPPEVKNYQSVEAILQDLNQDEVFVIGGEQIYYLFIKHASKMYLTEIDAEEKTADAYFPEFDKSEWSSSVLDETTEPIPYKHVEYVKKKKF